MNYQINFDAIKDFVEILEKYNIRYVIVGSIADVFYGKVTFAYNVDIMVEPFRDLAEKIYENLRPRFHISKSDVYKAAIGAYEDSSFKIFYKQTSFKISVFICQDIFCLRQILEHPKMVKLSEQLEKKFSLIIPEDIILLVIRNYRSTDLILKMHEGDIGYCTYETCRQIKAARLPKQWDYILGFLTIQRDKLDYDYLKRWAQNLGLADLLQKALSEIN